MSALMHQFPSAFLKKYFPRFLPGFEIQTFFPKWDTLLFNIISKIGQMRRQKVVALIAHKKIRAFGV